MILLLLWHYFLVATPIIAAVCVAAVILVGVVGSVLVVYCCYITRCKKQSEITATCASSTRASPVYDDVIVYSGPKPLELKENIAYGLILN